MRCLNWSSRPAWRTRANRIAIAAMLAATCGITDIEGFNSAAYGEQPADKTANLVMNQETASSLSETGLGDAPDTPAEDVYDFVESDASPHLTYTKNGKPFAISGWVEHDGSWVLVR